MNKKKVLPVDYNKPVAYDTNGQPLYAHPPMDTPDSPNKLQTVHMMRSSEPVKQIISDSAKLKNKQSKKVFPDLNLSEGEYVIRSVDRSPIGLIVPLGLGVILILITIIFLFNIGSFIDTFKLNDSSAIVFASIIFILLIMISMYINYLVFINNKFYLTNESVIQEIQNSLFSKCEQTVSLDNIEDVSFTQEGIIQQIFNYGSIRLSTEGEETTYRFSYVANPRDSVAVLNNAVEAFKNGRPVSCD